LPQRLRSSSCNDLIIRPSRLVTVDDHAFLSQALTCGTVFQTNSVLNISNNKHILNDVCQACFYNLRPMSNATYLTSHHLRRRDCLRCSWLQCQINTYGGPGALRKMRPPFNLKSIVINNFSPSNYGFKVLIQSQMKCTK